MGTNPLVIVDRSGSMSGESHKKCLELCHNIPKPYEVWLFGNVIEKKGLCYALPEYKCNTGTNITNMLNELHDWMKLNRGKYVILLTDDQDHYDKENFKQKFSQLVGYAHTVSIYDITGSNVERLNYIFDGFSVKIAAQLEEMTRIMEGMKTLIETDNQICVGLKSSKEKSEKLSKNLLELQDQMFKLVVEGEKLKKDSRNTIVKAEESLYKKTKDLLDEAAKRLSEHAEALIGHLIGHMEKSFQNIVEAKELRLRAQKLSFTVKSNKQKITSASCGNSIRKWEAENRKLEEERKRLIDCSNELVGENKKMTAEDEKLFELANSFLTNIQAAKGNLQNF
jgi:hypothetical protein